MKKIYYTILVLIGSLGTLLAQNDAQVSAYQAGAYQPGIMNVRDLAAVGPGLIFISYNYWNNSNSYYDRNGNKVDGLDTPNNGHIDLSQQVGGYSTVPVIFWASKFKVLGATYMATFAPSYLSSNYRMNVHIDKNDQDKSSSGNAAGWGDMAIMPLGLSWTIGDNIDLSFFYTMYVPTGKYENGGSDNIGRGYWTHQFQVPFYYYMMEKSTAIFIMPTYEINGTVEDSDVKPGSRMTLEYGISQYITPWLELEVLNGHNWQVGNDSGNDIWWKDTPMYTKDKTSTVSFGVGVWPWEGRLNIRAKYAMDYGVEQRYKSNFWSLSAIFIPNILN